jgi:hypothetical protein
MNVPPRLWSWHPLFDASKLDGVTLEKVLGLSPFWLCIFLLRATWLWCSGNLDIMKSYCGLLSLGTFISLPFIWLLILEPFPVDLLFIRSHVRMIDVSLSSIKNTPDAAATRATRKADLRAKVLELEVRKLFLFICHVFSKRDDIWYSLHCKLIIFIEHISGWN